MIITTQSSLDQYHTGPSSWWDHHTGLLSQSDITQDHHSGVKITHDPHHTGPSFWCDHHTASLPWCDPQVMSITALHTIPAV